MPLTVTSGTATGAGTIGTETEKLEMMAFNDKTRLFGNELLKDREVAVTALNRL